MNEPGKTTAPTTDELADPSPGGVPPGDHPLEIAARSGFGPLSPAAIDVWHGGARPCVTCGQLVRRDGSACFHCGQDLSPEMIERMRLHAGPWYVLEHLRPFPGVSLDRIIRQVHRGLITETSIVRGPTTDYQWRFAVETPGLCRLFRKCWQCHGTVEPAESICRSCGASLSFDRPMSRAPSEALSGLRLPESALSPDPQRGGAALPGSGWSRDQLALLRVAVEQSGRRHPPEPAQDVMKIGGVRLAWLAIIIVAAVFIALIAITRARSVDATASIRTAEPSMIVPQRDQESSITLAIEP